jgi:hypothetical protein
MVEMGRGTPWAVWLCVGTGVPCNGGGHHSSHRGEHVHHARGQGMERVPGPEEGDDKSGCASGGHSAVQRSSAVNSAESIAVA